MTAPPTAGQLHAAAADLAAAGRPVPCQQGTRTDRAAWTSEDPLVQAHAAERCRPCPLATPCRTYAVHTWEPAGVYGTTLPGRRGGTGRITTHAVTEALTALDHPATVREVAAHLLKDPTTRDRADVSGALGRLVATGHATTTPHPRTRPPLHPDHPHPAERNSSMNTPTPLALNLTATTPEDIDRLLAEHPRLNVYGHGRARGHTFDPEHARARLYSDDTARQADLAKDWLARRTRTTTDKTRRRRLRGRETTPSSYTLKHDMERETGTYTSNGAFIIAAWSLGIDLGWDTGFNPTLDIEIVDDPTRNREPRP